jgi:DDE superfamily endonuclease
MDSALMKQYIDYLNSVRNNDGFSAPMLMVYDSFRGHLEESVKKKFKDNGYDLAVIPGGLTSLCQPLDVAINKPFKDNLRKEWHLWMADGGAGQTAGGNLRRAKYSDVCGWVKRSWEQISNEIIINSFKNCHISDTLDNLDISDDDNLENSDKENDSDDDASVNDIE